MGVRVATTRRTWLLILLAAVIAGFLALWSARAREERRAREAPPSAPDAGYEVEVEIEGGP